MQRHISHLHCLFSAVPQVFFIQYFLFHFLCQCSTCGVEREDSTANNQPLLVQLSQQLSPELSHPLLCTGSAGVGAKTSHWKPAKGSIFRILIVRVAACYSNFSQTCSFTFEDKATNTNLHEKIYLKLVLNY